MKTTGSIYKGSRSIYRALSIMAALALATGSAMAEIEGFIVHRNGQRMPASGFAMMRYRAIRDSYTLRYEGRRLEISRRDVERAIPRESPPRFDQLARVAQSDNPAAAIPRLESVMESYVGFEYDIQAARYLAEAYLTMNNPEKAVEKVEVVIQANPAAVGSPDLAPLYWKALSQAGKDRQLERALNDAIERGTRAVAAQAQIMRGKADMERGEYRDALVNGFLRTILLYKEIERAQPEALYYAVRAHEQLGEHTHAEKFRRKLLSNHPQSSYSQRLQSGS